MSVDIKAGYDRVMRRFPKIMARLAARERQRCDECSAMAVWQYAPADTYGSYCDDHVPRGCSCNRSWNDEAGECDGEEQCDQFGRPLPCIECEYDAAGFEPGDREEVERYRAKWGYAPHKTP